jgi:hypothetical protein
MRSVYVNEDRARFRQAVRAFMEAEVAPLGADTALVLAALGVAAP